MTQTPLPPPPSFRRRPESRTPIVPGVAQAASKSPPFAKGGLGGFYTYTYTYTYTSPHQHEPPPNLIVIPVPTVIPVSPTVIPAKAGIHPRPSERRGCWIPAYAGMTVGGRQRRFVMAAPG